jgi:hypothetical protein
MKPSQAFALRCFRQFEVRPGSLDFAEHEPGLEIDTKDLTKGLAEFSIVRLHVRILP